MKTGSWEVPYMNALFIFTSGELKDMEAWVDSWSMLLRYLLQNVSKNFRQNIIISSKEGVYTCGLHIGMSMAMQ